MMFGNQTKEERRAVYIVGALLLAGVLVRLYASWCLRHNLNLDAGVVALMAKHIAEGRALPVFFYGQPHMGSLEALFSGLFGRLFGVSGFAVCLGTAFVSFWLLPIVYCWARNAAGRMAGYAALAFVVIGPGGFFHYSASPRGAYASALTLGALVLWYATRMAIRWDRKQRQSALDFFLLGIGAGLAWWNSQLTTASILTAALILLITMRFSVFTWRLVPGVAGFLIGSAPFWIYNLLHNWPSFAFAGTFGRVKLTDGLFWFFTDRFASLMLPTAGPVWLRYLVTALYMALTLFALFLLWRTARAKDERPLFITLLGLLLFTILFSVLYASSHFAAIPTPRYFLPMVAPIAVLLGVAVTPLARRVPTPVAWLPVVFLIAMQLPVFAWARGFERSAQAQQERLEQFAELLDEKSIDTLYAVNRRRSWNFALRERFAFVDLRHDFYRPHAQRAELTDRIAVLDNYGLVADFMRTTGGSMDIAADGRLAVQYGFQPPQGAWEEIPPDAWHTVTDRQGSDVRDVLTDGRLHTYWETADEDELIIALAAPTHVTGLRVVATHPHGYPFRWSVSGRTMDGERVTLFERQPFTQYFWSGPRPYWGGPYHRMDIRFEPRELTHLRITHHPERDDWNWSMHTLQVFGPSNEQATRETDAIAELMDLLNERGIRRLYADRWLANRIHRQSDGRIRTTLDPTIFPDDVPLPEAPMQLSPDTALITRTEDAPALRRVLESRFTPSQITQAGRANRPGEPRMYQQTQDAPERVPPPWSETSVGPWTLFGGWPYEEPLDPGLHWTGFGALRDDGRWGTTLYQKAAERIARDQIDTETRELLEEALAHNPHLYSARRALPDVLRRLGDQAGAEKIEAELRALAEPEHAAHIRYPNGVEFLGYRLDLTSARPGESVRMTYFWRCPPDLVTHHFAVFVHFLSDRRIAFQDDHIFLSDFPRPLLTAQPDSPVLAVTRDVQVPAEIGAGPVNIAIGIYDRRHGNRLRARTDLPTRRNAVTLPVPFDVEMR